jgi:hypothetical protein
MIYPLLAAYWHVSSMEKNDTTSSNFQLSQGCLLTLYTKEQPQKMIGCAIKICYDINRSELGDEFTQVVQECFTPDEQPDLNNELYSMVSDLVV